MIISVSEFPVVRSKELSETNAEDDYKKDLNKGEIVIHEETKNLSL